MAQSKKAVTKKSAPAKKNAPAKKATTVKKAAAPKKAAPKKAAKDAPKKTAQPKQTAPKKEAKKPAPDKSKATGKKVPEMSQETAARVAAAMARNGVVSSNTTQGAEKVTGTLGEVLDKALTKEANAPVKQRSNPKVTKTKDILMEGRQRALRNQVQDATYTSFAELNNKNLKTGNRVIFDINGEKYTYAVTDSTLSLLPELFTNDAQPDPLAIFKASNIEAAKLARRCFAYDSTTNGDAFPHCKAGDLSNLTRLVLALYLFNDGAKAVSIKMVNRHWKTIEADDVAPGAPELPLQDQASEAAEA